MIVSSFNLEPGIGEIAETSNSAVLNNIQPADNRDFPNLEDIIPLQMDFGNSGGPLSRGVVYTYSGYIQRIAISK